jgi:hypothetical protein
MPLLGSRGAASLTGFGGLAKLGYLLRNSLRFRASNSAYLSRTGGTPSNGKTATYSFWMKRGNLSSGTEWLFTGGTTVSLVGFNAGGDLISVFGSDSSAEGNITTAVFRDPAAWYHVVIRINTTEGTAADRAKIYVNGVQQSVITNAGGIVLDSNWGFNTAGSLAIGRYNPTTSGYSDVYLAEIHFIDGGTPPLPSAFAKTDPVTGQWIPIKYTGTYGNNGFYLNFNDTSNTTAATLGKDSSGRGNNWTPNNFSITAGATYDPVTDVPTLTSATAANYATLNPLTPPLDGTLSNGNLTVAYGNATNRRGITATMGMVTGKFYWEVTVTASSANPCNANLGISNTTDNWSGNSTGIGLYVGYTANGWSYYANDGTKYNNGSGDAYGATFTTNDVIGVAFDADTRTLTFYKQTGGTGSFVSQGVAYTGLAAGTYFPAISDGGGGSTITMAINFGQRPFNNTSLPSGYKALNTFNLP